MKRVKLLISFSISFIVVVLMFLPACTSTSSSTPITMKAVSIAGPTYPARILLEKAIKLIAERSGGRIKSEYYPENQLLPDTEKMDGLAKNIIQVGMVQTGAEQKRLGIAADIEWMPFCYNGELVGKLQRDKGNLFDFQQKYYEKYGIKMVARTVVSARQALFTKPVKVLEDLKGKLVSCPPGMDTQVVKLLGASPTYLEQTEVYVALQKGTIDGCSGYSMGSIFSYKQHEVAPYIVKIDYAPAVLPIAVNLKWYNDLPSDLRNIVWNTFLELEKEHYAGYNDLVQKEINQVKTQPGVQIYEVPAAERARWIKAVEPLYDEFAKKYPNEWPEFMKIRKTLLGQ
jgi:C4-dicarboxylate-binding protein DctP